MPVLPSVQRAAAWLTLGDESNEFAVKQLVKLRRQLPPLYLLLIINMIAVAYTHHGLAPRSLTVYAPLVFSSICAARAVFWARHIRTVFSVRDSIGHMRRIVLLSSLLSVAFVGWALTLDTYGGPYEKGHVAFFVAITVIGCIFCLTHLPQAALMVTGTVLVPYMAYYVNVGHPVFIAIACNLSLVTLVIVQVLFNNYRAFLDLERSKAALASEQAQSRILSGENALLANTDSLTGLPNRRAFFGRLEELIAGEDPSEATFALGVLDLDGFKPINDSLGHAIGDRVLLEIGLRLRDLGERCLMTARLGGDEFGVLFTGPTDEAALAEFGRRLCHVLSLPLLIDGMHLGCGASCGIALSSGSARGAAALYNQADYALYDAKAHRRGDAVVFGAVHEARLGAERAIEAALIAADSNTEMSIHFQPIVDLATGRDVAAEALARWDSPLLGSVPTDRFIEVAERTGLIRTLTPVLLRKALAGAVAWPRPLGLSFNLSAHDIVSPETVLSLLSAVRDSRIDATRVTFEITETALMRDFDLARRHILLLRAAGMQIALDDFGAGYSSLSCVHRLPLDRIKVDRSFVRDIENPSGGGTIVRTILHLCATLGLDCVVEGVETAEQAGLVSQLGGAYAQGYHFARPLPPAEFARRFDEPDRMVA